MNSYYIGHSPFTSFGWVVFVSASWGKLWYVPRLKRTSTSPPQSVLFQAAFPERYFEMGIATQNMVSAAAGLAPAGKIPFVHSFAVFASGRVYDQLRNSVCIPNLNVRICGSSSGLSDFGDGKTHPSVEEVSLMRALPR